MSRSARTLAVGAAAAAVVALLLVAGALRTGSQSLPFRRDVNRSYAQQVSVLVGRSNATGRQLGSLAPRMAGRSRAALEASLDTLVQQAQVAARQAEQLESPAPTGGAGGDVAQAFAQRATALADLKRTLDRLLGLSPLPTVTSADPPDTVAPTPPPLAAAAAVTALERVGATIAASNRSYAAGRRALRDGPGRAVLPPSVWHTGSASWSPTGAASLVAAMGSSPTLAALHDVVLVTDALALTPAPVPSPTPPATGGSAGTAGSTLEIPPTGTLSVSVVVADHGNVPARGVTVTVEVAPQTGKPPTRRARTASLAPGMATTVRLPAAPVAPDGHYTVTVTVSPPVPNATAGAVTTDTLSVTVAPPTPPAVAQIKPAKGPSRGGTTVVILGSRFGRATAVKFGTTDAVFTVVSGTEIKAVSPPGAGKVYVTVDNAGGPSGYSSGNLFTYKGGAPASTTTTTTAPASG
jgi:IPT/TIG domain